MIKGWKHLQFSTFCQDFSRGSDRSVIEPKPKQTGGFALLMQESARHIRPKMKASLARRDSLLCHVGYNLPVTGIKYQRIVRIISICSHFLPTRRKDMWEDELHGGLKINPKLAITVNFQACIELSGFHWRLVSLCGCCLAAGSRMWVCSDLLSQGKQ